MSASSFDSAAFRQRAVAMAVALTADTALAPQRYERQLLSLYQRGVLTIEEVVELLDLSIYQVLYHSQAIGLPGEAQLQDLLAQSRLYNAAHHITGLLLYSNGRYVQVLEGRESDVRALYARIQQDPRHQQVVTVHEGPAGRRHFADWSLDYGQVSLTQIEWVLQAVQAPPGVVTESPGDTRLRTLLHAFEPEFPAK